MSFVVRPPFDAARPGLGGDDLDRVLRGFFRAEMPRPWPEPRTPRAVTPPARSYSRWALAASVGLLLLGSWALGSALKSTVPDTSRPGLGATAKPTLPAPRPGR